MKKLGLLSVAVSTLVMAEAVQTESLEALLESKKTGSAKTEAFPLKVSLILDASYNHISFDDESETAHLEIPGLVHGGGEEHAGHSHTSLAGEDGLNFNYAELSIGATVDNYFDLATVFHITEDDFEVEEAYVTTRTLPYGLQARLGKFKSEFGYLNNKHHHNYDFSDMPLIYMALLGDHGLNEKGAQLQYVLPFSHYVMAGVEMLRGENEQSFGTGSFAPLETDESFTGIDKVDQPNLWLGYIKTSHDIGGGTLLAGLSMAKGDAHIDHLEDEEGPHAFAGETMLYGADVTYKYYFAADHAITLQSEYLYREMDGIQYVPTASGDDWAKQVGLKKNQGGFYTQAVYQYDRYWRAGARYSAITQNDVLTNGIDQDKADDMYITSAMLEYNPSEFSRIRLQYNHNSSLYTDEGIKNNKDEIVLQFNYAIGAHGAHAF